MEEESKNPLKSFSLPSNINKISLVIILAAVFLGVLSGYLLTRSGPIAKKATSLGLPPKSASQDSGTFRDFAEGTIKVKAAPKDPNEYTEGTHILERGQAYPVALTSSVVDLSLYEGKKVKVFGETQKALKEGWLMDVGRVEETK